MSETLKPEDMNDLIYSLIKSTCSLYAGEGEEEEFLAGRYGVSIETFIEIVSDLMPFAVRSKSPLTGQLYMGFADHEQGFMLLKKEIKAIL